MYKLPYKIGLGLGLVIVACSCYDHSSCLKVEGFCNKSVYFPEFPERQQQVQFSSRLLEIQVLFA